MIMPGIKILFVLPKIIEPKRSVDQLELVMPYRSREIPSAANGSEYSFALNVRNNGENNISRPANLARLEPR